MKEQVWAFAYAAAMQGMLASRRAEDVALVAQIAKKHADEALKTFNATFNREDYDRRSP